MNDSTFIRILGGVIEILLGIWGLIVSGGTFLISAFIDDPNGAFTSGWALLVFVLALSTVIGGVFTLIKKFWYFALFGGLASVAFSLPFAMLILPDFSLDNGFHPDTLMAFGWLLSAIPLFLVYRTRQQFH